MQEYTIRTVPRAKHAEAVALIADLLYDDGFAEDEAIFDLMEWTQRSGTIFCGAYDVDNGLVGVVFVVRYDTFYYMQAIGVASGHRGRGLGKRLLWEAVRRCQALPVWAKIEDGNHASMAMFKSAGFAKRPHSATPSPLSVDVGTEYFPYVHTEEIPQIWDWYQEVVFLQERIRQIGW